MFSHMPSRADSSRGRTLTSPPRGHPLAGPTGAERHSRHATRTVMGFLSSRPSLPFRSSPIPALGDGARARTGRIHDDEGGQGALRSGSPARPGAPSARGSAGGTQPRLLQRSRLVRPSLHRPAGAPSRALRPRRDAERVMPQVRRGYKDSTCTRHSKQGRGGYMALAAASSRPSRRSTGSWIATSSRIRRWRCCRSTAEGLPPASGRRPRVTTRCAPARARGMGSVLSASHHRRRSLHP